MKLSKKIVAIILTMAMVIAQVSVLPFAENSYASGKGDSASYAMRVPSDEKVSSSGTTAWIRTTASVGRNEGNTGYATNYIFTEEIGTERFFVMTPQAGAATSNTYLMFKNNPYNTYSSETTRLFNGIPDCIPSGIEGMAFRVKGGATATDKMYLNIAISAKGTGNSGYNYVAKNDLVFYDAVTGAKSTVTFDAANGGILLAGNVDGYIYAPLTGIVNGTTAVTESELREQATANGNNVGYRGIQYKFGTTDFGGKTLYIGDAYFVGDDADFDIVHAAPAAPTLKEATASSIEVNTESGMLYAIEKNGLIGEYTANGLFEGLESGTTYKVYAKKDNANALYATYAELSTKGILTPVASEVTHNSIKVEVAEGQEYSIDGETWNTTGEFTGLDSATEYTITTRSIEDNTLVRTLNVITKSEPYSYVKGDGAYYALQIADGTVKLDSTKVTASANLGRNDDNTDYAANGNLFMTNIDSVQYIVLAPEAANGGTASIKATNLTYGTVSGIPDAIEKFNSFEAIAVRLKVAGTASADSKFSFALGSYTMADGEYTFVNAADGKQSTLTSEGGFSVVGEIDGFVVIPFSSLKTAEGDAVTAAKLKTGYVTFDIAMSGDWTDRALYVNSALFLTDTVTFLKVHSVPAEPKVTEITKTSVTIKPQEGVIYSIDGGVTWTDASFDGKFAGLTVESVYAVYAKYDGATNYLEFNIATRDANISVQAPVATLITGNKIEVNVVDFHEYSISTNPDVPGTEWNRTGIFSGLDSATVYYVFARITEDEGTPVASRIETTEGKYSTGNGDSANYMFRIPNTDKDGNSLPTTTDQFGDTVEYGNKYNGVTAWFGENIGRNPANTSQGRGSDSSGSYLIKTIDGERFIQMTPLKNEDASAQVTPFMPFDGSIYYGDADFRGIPEEIGIGNINGFAYRIKLDNLVNPIGLTFYFPMRKEGSSSTSHFGHGTPNDQYQYKFIDAKTGKVSILGYDKVLKFTEESYDGWVVIPKELYSAEALSLLETKYAGIQIWVHASNCSHGGTWSKWGENSTFYVGDSLFINDMNKFILEHSAPEAPEMDSKTTTTIKVKPVAGVEYALDKNAPKAQWNTTGEFTGLTENTKYTVYARYIDRTNTSSLTLYTDMSNPPLIAPQNPVSTTSTIKVDVIPGLEYSIDGVNWNEFGEFTGLIAETVYEVVARNKVTHETSEPTRVETKEGKYSTYRGDGTNYMFRVPNTDKTGKPLPTTTDHRGNTVEYITKALGVNSWIGAGIGRLPSDPTVTKNSDAGGAYFIREFDGEKFIQLTPTTSSEANTNITVRMPYNGLPYYGSTAAIGLPDYMTGESVDGFAFRIRIDNIVTPVGFTFYLPMKKVGAASSTSFSHLEPKPEEGLEYKFIDAKTGAISTLEYQKVIKFTKESYDGWVVIPRELYSEEAMSLLETEYNGIQAWAHGGNCTNHGAAWSLWHPDTDFYLGDSVFLKDVDQFLLANSAPETPVKVNKTSTTINVKPVAGVEYSLDKNAPASEWNTSGSFAGLTPHTLYTVYARYTGRTHTSALALYTDMENPPLTAPQNAVATQTTIKVDVIPGLEYSIDGKIWNEEGEWAGLEAETTYTVRARVKGTTQEATTNVTTLEYINIYVTDLDPNLSWLTKVPDPAVSPTVGRDWGWAGAAMSPNLADGASIPVRDFNGEFFIEYTTYKRSDTQFGLRHSQTFPGHTTLPVELNLHKQEALVLRVKATGVTGSSTPAKFSFYTSTSSGYSIVMDKNSTIFFVQKDTGWTRAATGSDRQTFTEDFDGYIVVPMTSLLADGKSDMEWLKNKWSNVTPWLHDTSCTHGMGESCWDGKFYYQGNNYFAYDMDLFLKQYSAPDAPTLKVKSTTYITVNDIDGALYSIDNGATWQESPTFTGLTENTAYSIIAKYKINEKGLVSKAFNTSTDMANPPLDTPELISLDDEYAVIKVIPGLEYSHDGGKTWNETGVFGILDPNTDYTIIGRNKITKESTAPLEIHTPNAPNPYLNEDGITSKWFTMTRYGDKYKEYWFGAMVFVPDAANSTPEVPAWKPAYNYNAGGELDVVTDENGERFVNFHIQEGKKPDAHKTNFTLSGQKTYQKSDNGFPRAIWVRDCWGMAIRMKIEDVGNENLGFTLYINSEKNGQATFKQGSTYYLVDKETKTWQKKSLNGNFKLTGFDGWLMVPFNSMNLTMEQIQYGFKTIQIFHNGDAENSWMGVDFMVGESVVVHDAQAFVDLYAPNTTDKIAGEAHNVMEDETIPAIMANDCSGNEIGNGIHSFDNTRATVRQITKVGGQASKALAVNAAGGTFSAIRFSNDSLNYKEVPQEKEFQVMDSLGMSFYLEVPEEASEKVGFDVEILEEGTEYYTYSRERFYYTIEDGQIRRYFDKLEFKPGFKGYVILPYENFDINLDSSEIVDGMLFSPHRIEYFSFIFDADTYPALGEVALIVDDFMQWQDLEEFGTALIKKQGGSEFKVMDVVLTLHNDDSGLPRMMANDGTGIEVEKGIFSLSNVELSLVDIKGTIDSYVKVKIGNGNSNVMFGNYGIYDDQSTDEYEKILNSEGITFTVNVPKDAPMIVGMDLELCENYDDYLEYYLYDADTFYYTVENGEVYKVYGYLEFEPGFNGTVIIPFENFWFDEDYSDYYDGELNDKDCIEYFGFYFSTNYYAAIGGTEIGIDSIAYYDGAAFDYIDAVWSQQTGKTGKK